MATVLLSKSLITFQNKTFTRLLNLSFGSSRIASSAYQKWPTIVSFYIKKPRSQFVLWRYHNNVTSVHVSFALPEFAIKKQRFPEGNFRGNQLLDGSMSLSPLYPTSKIDLRVRTSTSLHPSLPGLDSIQA